VLLSINRCTNPIKIKNTIFRWFIAVKNYEMKLSKNHTKLIASLQQKKYRQKHQLFLAEGVKVVRELLASSLEVAQIFATTAFETAVPAAQLVVVSEAELKKISQLKTPNKVVGIFKIPQEKTPVTTGLCVALDGINDPGNLGTIIRLCDWFGVSQLLCSTETVDCYNAKVVQASMGSLTRVAVNYVALPTFLETITTPVYAADMHGENIYQTTLPKEAILVLGNEANGISKEMKNLISNTIAIPRFGDVQETESLNVATAGAILLSEFRRG